MKKLCTRLNIARLSLIASIIVGAQSLGSTFAHVGNEKFLLNGFMDGTSLAPTHGWYHFFREGFGDLAALAVFLLLLFGPKVFRTPQTWVIALILCFGYYAPFWIGMPFNPELSAPSMTAELTHVGMAVLAVGAFFIAKKDFFDNK